MGTKRPYEYRVKVKRGWINKRTGRVYRKGTIATIRLSKGSHNDLKAIHRIEGTQKQPYKILSVNKRSRR